MKGARALRFQCSPYYVNSAFWPSIDNFERALKFAELFAVWMGVKVPEWRAETYFSFVTKFMLGMGLGFELPVVLLALVKIGSRYSIP